METSISEVFETMFFLPLEMNDQISLEASGLMNTGQTIACRIDFTGSFSGYFILFIPEKLGFHLAVSFMGAEEEEITDMHISGTIKEAINMLAGSTFTSFDNTIEFQLTIPETTDVNQETVPGGMVEEREIVVIAETAKGYLALKAVIESGYV